MDTIPEKEPYIQSLNPAWFQPYVEKVDMLRLDEIHPVVSGNKWYKLKQNITQALSQNCNCVFTFGGPYSNHLIATAAAARQFEVLSIGVVRGMNNKDGVLTHTLKACLDNGMVLFHVSKEDYRTKSAEDFIREINLESKDVFVIPEGGANKLGRKGSEEIAEHIPGDYTHICISVGSGTTLSGIRNALPSNQLISGYVPMKKGTYMKGEIDQHLDTDKKDSYKLFDSWHCGGFGKWNDTLIAFMNSFYQINHIPLDIVYTGKMMLGLQEQLHSGYFLQNARILCVHTGGLQGNTSVQNLLTY